MLNYFTRFGNRILYQLGEQTEFLKSFFTNIFRKGFEWNELIRQCYLIGYRSASIVLLTGFVLGFVLTLQTEPSMKAFGAESLVPGMVAISVIREISPVIIALICAGKISSGIGAELGSMNVSEQIDAMEVSGANPGQIGRALLSGELEGLGKNRYLTIGRIVHHNTRKCAPSW